MTLVLIGKDLVLKGSTTKIEDKQVPGHYRKSLMKKQSVRIRVFSHGIQAQRVAELLKELAVTRLGGRKFPQEPKGNHRITAEGLGGGRKHQNGNTP